MCATKKRTVTHVHDLAWRQLLGHRTALRRLLEDYLPELGTLLRRLELGRAEVVPTSFVDPDLRAVESDILWRIPIRRRRACFVYVLIEHQSAPSHLMALRMLRYVAAVYGAIVAEAGKKAKARHFLLPAVVPVVLYCGARRWDAPRRFRELISGDVPLPEPFTDGRYLLVEVNRMTGERLLEAHSLAVLGELEHENGEYEAAIEHLEASLEIRRELADRPGVGWMLYRMARANSALGSTTAARGLAASAAQIAEELADRELGDACRALHVEP